MKWLGHEIAIQMNKQIVNKYYVYTILDFWCKLGMKPYMLLVEIIIFSLYQFIGRPTKIMKTADKNWARFEKIN